VTAIPLITDGTSSVPKCKVVGICKWVLVVALEQPFNSSLPSTS
jgi:hypothetical protein